MTDNKDKNGKLTQKDQRIWDDYVADMQPIEPAETTAEESFADLLDNHIEQKTELSVDPPKAETETTISTNAKKPNAHRSQEIDKNTYARLKKGQIPIEDRLDLHGLNQGQARQALIEFLTQSHALGQRCVIVITGKGRNKDKSKSTSNDWLAPSKGVLKSQLPIWLDENPCREIVLKHTPAIPKDGGNGAFYIYLRRKR